MISLKKHTPYCALIGFVQGLIALWPVLERLDKSYNTPYIPFWWAILAFPFFGTICAVALSSVFDPEKFGVIRGLILSVEIFFAFCLVVSVVSIVQAAGTIEAVFIIPLVVIAFGALWVGWLMLPVGGFIGLAYRINANKR